MLSDRYRVLLYDTGLAPVPASWVHDDINRLRSQDYESLHEAVQGLRSCWPSAGEVPLRRITGGLWDVLRAFKRLRLFFPGEFESELWFIIVVPAADEDAVVEALQEMRRQEQSERQRRHFADLSNQSLSEAHSKGPGAYTPEGWQALLAELSARNVTGKGWLARLLRQLRGHRRRP